MRVLAAVRGALVPGTREIDLMGLMYAEMARHGGEEQATGRVMVTRDHAAIRCTYPQAGVIQQGDLLMVDMCASYNRYHGNVARVLAGRGPLLGGGGAGARRPACRSFLRRSRPGAPLGDVQKLMDAHIDEAGLAAVCLLDRGYSLGIAFPGVGGPRDLDPHEGFETHDFVPNYVTNYEHVLHSDEQRAGCGFIDTLIMTERASTSRPHRRARFRLCSCTDRAEAGRRHEVPRDAGQRHGGQTCVGQGQRSRRSSSRTTPPPRRPCWRLDTAAPRLPGVWGARRTVQRPPSLVLRVHRVLGADAGCALRCQHSCQQAHTIRWRWWHWWAVWRLDGHPRTRPGTTEDRIGAATGLAGVRHPHRSSKPVLAMPQHGEPDSKVHIANPPSHVVWKQAPRLRICAIDQEPPFRCTRPYLPCFGRHFPLLEVFARAKLM